MTTFEQAMNEVLETSRYDFLTGRRVDIRELLGEITGRFFTWLINNLDFNMPTGIGGNARTIATIFTIIVVILIMIALVVLIRAYRRSRIPKRHNLQDIFEEIKNHTVDELLELSNTAESRRVAVRYKYIAAILWLNENDIIVIEPSDTNKLILRQIKESAPSLVAPFSKIAEGFHLTWFGHKAFGDDDFAVFNEAVEKTIGGVIFHA
ncbi:MAG: hypothetical protein FWF78_02870 [Defluviitaleaceae bacterium]|nr:hypothetical protein [Defluviitaleaceae bacterium]